MRPINIYYLIILLEIIKTYRQQLRDFTLNNFILPDKPDFVNILNN